MAQLTQSALAYLPPSIRQLIAGDARRELLKQVNAQLMVFDSELVNLQSGEAAPIPIHGSIAEAESLAQAARRLLGDDVDDLRLQLLLPTAEFVATSVRLPGVSRDNLVSAVALQVDSLLPAFDEPLALGVNPASAELGEEHVAIWLRRARLDELFSAFEAQGLFLAAVKPRPLGLAEKDIETRYLDRDQQVVTAAAVTNGVVTQWLQIEVLDLEQADFLEQWQQELKSHPTGQTVESSRKEDYLERTDKIALSAYCFYPGGALLARKRVDQGRQLIAAGVAILFLAVLASIPFLLQSWEFRQAAETLAANSELSQEARADQSVVVNFENEWGPINDFPDQNIPQAMFTLQEVLLPDQLSSLEISEGLISIEGTSNDPQAILQRLEQNPLFTEVVFARATNNTRYYIDLRLSPVNFEAYMRRYFPDE